jgi:dihydrofolate synthase/folylpolyglutamate synthase
MQIKSYESAVKYLEGFIGKIIFKVDPKSIKEHDPLERMRIFLSLLGNPQEKFKSILVGGTSGKGSTAYLVSHILTTAGYKTGLTISPHLQKINERLQINEKQITDKKFTDLLVSILSSIEGMKKMPIGAPSYFEILVGMVFTYFAKEKVDVAVVEVGMGGEFDATNTLNPLIAVLTNVGLDHTNVLGNTVEKIAKTKAGIIKGEGVIVATAVKQPSVIKIVEEKCRKVGAMLFLLGRNSNYKIKKESSEGSVFDLTFDSDRIKMLNNLELSLLVEYQVENASLAIKTVLELEKLACLPAGRGFKIADEAIRKALKTAFFPGRFEIVKPILRLPLVAQDKISSTLILDGAHNPTKMKAFIYSLKKLYPNDRKTFLIAFKNDKDIPKMLREILRAADLPAGRQDEIIVTEFNRATDMVVSASADALKIKDQILKIKYGRDVIVEEDSGKALKKALAIQQFSNSTIIVVTGSLYLVGEIRSSLVLKKNG